MCSKVTKEVRSAYLHVEEALLILYHSALQFLMCSTDGFKE